MLFCPSLRSGLSDLYQKALCPPLRGYRSGAGWPVGICRKPRRRSGDRRRPSPCSPFPGQSAAPCLLSPSAPSSSDPLPEPFSWHNPAADRPEGPRSFPGPVVAVLLTPPASRPRASGHSTPPLSQMRFPPLGTLLSPTSSLRRPSSSVAPLLFYGSPFPSCRAHSILSCHHRLFCPPPETGVTEAWISGHFSARARSWLRLWGPEVVQSARLFP